MKKKIKPSKFTALQWAQLQDCQANGMTPPKFRAPRETLKGFTDTPLFSTDHQSKLF